MTSRNNGLDTRSLFAIALIFVLSTRALCQVSPNVSISDEVYRDLDRLTAFGLIDDRLYGLRPYARSEVARLIAEARERLAAAQNSTDTHRNFPYHTADSILTKLERQFSADIELLTERSPETLPELNLVKNLTVTQNYFDSPSRPVPPDIRYGEIDAFTNPLYGHRDGKRFLQGSNSYLEFQNHFRVGGLLSVEFTPYFYLGVPKNGGDKETHVVVQQLSVKFGIRNFELQIGRYQAIWGQGEFGGMLLSNNPRPFDMVKISTVHPVELPGFLRALGRTGGSVFVARLGKNRNFPHTKLIGLSVNFKPARSFELGLYHTYLFGGEGAPNSDFIDPIAEFFFVRRHGEAVDLPGSPNLADHRAGIELRYDAKALRHTEFYLEWMWDDFLSKILHDSAFLVGVHVPRVDASGRTGLRLEFRSLARILYRHADFTTGYAENGLFIGDPLGPKALSFSVEITREISHRVTFGTQLVYENRRGGNTGAFNFETTHEERVRTLSVLEFHHPSGWTVTGTAGYEHVSTFNYEPGATRDNILLEVSLGILF